MTLMRAGPLMAFVLCAVLPTVASAGDQFTCKGSVKGPQGALSGDLVISSNSVAVDKRWLWVRDNVAYDFKSLQSVRVRRGLLHTKAVLVNSDDSYVKIRTWAWNYDAVYALFESKL